MRYVSIVYVYSFCFSQQIQTNGGLQNTPLQKPSLLVAKILVGIYQYGDRNVSNVE